MKTMKQLSSLLLLTLPTVAQAQFNYTTNNGVITITKYTGPGGAVTIPGKINGLLVTCIGVTAFAGCSRLTSINIPDSVTSIAHDAFEGCGLTNVIIPDSVTSIEDGVFGDCYGLVSVMIPDSVTNIDSDAFYACHSLTNKINNPQ